MGCSDSKEATGQTEPLPGSSSSGSKPKPWWRKYSKSDSKKLLTVKPIELRFPFELNKQISCSMQLSNAGRAYVAFTVMVNNDPKKYTVWPNFYIMPPCSLCNVIVTHQAQDRAPPSMQCNDTFLVKSTVVRAGTTLNNITREMFANDSGNVVDELKLNVVYVQPPLPTSHVRERTEQASCSNGGNITGQDWQMDCDSNEMLTIEPGVLCFPFETKKEISCSMQLTNKTNDYMNFKVKATNPHNYAVKPVSGIVPPRATCDVIVILRAQKEAPPDMQCNDKFVVSCAMLRKGTPIEHITDKMFRKDSGNVVYQVELKVVYIQPPQPPSPMPEGSEKGSSPHTSSSNDGNVNYHDSKDFFIQTESTQHGLPLQHLKDITNNFCDERILGRGGFGVVYKGIVRDGKVIAVKKFVQSMSSSQKQFENEVNLLRKLEHTNIVRLVGFCYEMQPSQKLHEGKFIIVWDIQCLLCLEYLPKGSLDKYISDPSSGLDWPRRLKIIEGITYGVQYLHEQSDCPVVHLDLKPSNILLDENMIPKITDFGLSRLFDQEQTIHTIITHGTLGYMPPEYLRGIITPMFDIFSLGVLILEVITGHRDYPIDIRTSSTDFIDLELKRWRNVLQKEPGYTSLEIDCQQIKICIQIGLICVNPERTRRPTMKKIIDMLQGLESMNWYISNELSSHDNQAEL